MKVTIIGALQMLFALPLGAASTNYYQHIKPIVESKCQICHSESGVSFSFEKPEVAISFGPAMVAAVSERRMPPWLAEPGYREYADDYSLANSEIAMFQSWRDGGFSKGPIDNSVAGNKAKVSSSFKADLTLLVNNGETYLPDQNRKDDYRCFLMDWPQDDKTYVTGFQGRPGNSRVAHHLVLYVGRPEVVKTLQQLDGEEDGLGYQCFGGGIPDRIGDPKVAKRLEDKDPGIIDRLNEGVHWVSHWAPGMDGHDFPKDTGIPIEPGSVMIVQMHYFSAFAPGESDQNSKMSFKLAKQVKKPGFYIPLTNLAWLEGRKRKSMVIPAQQEVTYRIGLDFESFSKRAAKYLKTDLKNIETLELHSANIHMHAIGKSSKVYIEDKWGRMDTLLRIPKWDLNWQRDFTFLEPLKFQPKEAKDKKLVIECTFLNPKDTDVVGGFGSDDEMCFNFSYFALQLKSGLTH